MKKMTFEEVYDKFYKHNEEKGCSQFSDQERIVAVVVFKQGPWFNAEYTEQQRSYAFSSDNKYFIPGMGGNSIFADCLDGVERGVRLDWYLGKWQVDYCYIKEGK